MSKPDFTSPWFQGGPASFVDEHGRLWVRDSEGEWNFAGSHIYNSEPSTPDDPRTEDAATQGRTWEHPIRWAQHWPNVFILANDERWVGVCKCGQVFIGPDQEQVNTAMDAHMPAFTAWRDGRLE